MAPPEDTDREAVDVQLSYSSALPVLQEMRDCGRAGTKWRSGKRGLWRADPLFIVRTSRRQVSNRCSRPCTSQTEYHRRDHPHEPCLYPHGIVSRAFCRSSAGLPEYCCRPVGRPHSGRQDRQPIAATLLLFDQEGKPIEIDGKHPHVQYLGKRRCYVDGKFALSARPRELLIEIRRGLETLPLQSKVDLNQSSSESLTFRMRRWIDMREQGYINGDTHVHFLTQAESHLQMRAEDLNVLNLLVSDFTNDREKFTGKLDPVSTHGHEVFVGQELARLATRTRYPAGHQSNCRTFPTVWRHVSRSKPAKSCYGEGS